MKTTFFFLTLFLMAGNLFAELDANLEKEIYYNLPATTEIKLKSDKDILIYPNSPSAQLLAISEDADEDGIPDKLDWCPNTPKGVKVWTEERIKTDNKALNFLGCSFADNSKETWLENEKSLPSGYEYTCVLYFPPSGKYRYLAKDSSFTAQKRVSLSEKDFYATYWPEVKPFSPDSIKSYLSVKTKGGLDALLGCYTFFLKTKNDNGKYSLELGYIGRNNMTIKQLNNYFTLSNIPKPEVIGRR